MVHEQGEAIGIFLRFFFDLFVYAKCELSMSFILRTVPLILIGHFVKKHKVKLCVEFFDK